MRVLIIGAGGHAQVVADILLRMRETETEVIPVGYLDDNPELLGQSFLNLPVLGAIAHQFTIAHDVAIVAIGDNKIRRHLFTKMQVQGERFTIACHPRAVIAPDVQVSSGSMICAGVIINPGSEVGANVILNTGCTVDHHNHIGDHTHIAPGVHLGGEVTIGEGALIGIGATVLPRCRIGDWSVVGAGAVVIDNVPDGVVAVGVPAKIIKKREG